MGTSSKTSRVEQLAADHKFIDGTKQFLSHFSSLPVGSQDVTPAEIILVLEDLAAASNAAAAAADARKAAVKTERDKRRRAAPFVTAFKRIVIGMFLQSPDKLGVFGLEAPKVGKRTAAEKAVAVEKVNAIKKARGPIGRRQRAKVKGEVPTGTPNPAPGASTPAPTVSRPEVSASPHKEPE